MTFLTQSDVESEILRLSDELEKATERLAYVIEEAAKSDSSYKKEYYSNLLQAEGKTATVREANAHVVTSDLYRVRNIRNGQAEAQKELLRTLRSRLDALRTLSANVRFQTT